MLKQIYLQLAMLCFSVFFFVGDAHHIAAELQRETIDFMEEELSYHRAAMRELSPEMNREEMLDTGANEGVARLTWEMLEEIEYVERKHKIYGYVYVPTVNDRVRHLAGKQVLIKGFVIPVTLDEYAVSKNMMASCFFCGEGGPESVAGIKFKNKTPQLKTDQFITIQGKFRFNEKNPDEWIYYIEEASILKK